MIGASLNCRGVGKKGMSTFCRSLSENNLWTLLGCKKQLKKTILRLSSEGLILSTSFVGSGLLLLEDQVVF
jgi:hypothetical protein